MKTYFAYVRVSTTRQGDEGVSLREQRAAIQEYAIKRGLRIGDWFEEQLSAAKRGRPVFTRVVTLLKKRKAAGLIIHKIDRGARNLRDWADMADLMDSGVEVHFAHESIDLHTRSGRLSADILAVVAADYIRNLREETIKGINGRLKQGLFPFCAPVGYLNNGGGKVKTIDPVRGPLIRQAFELYASRRYSLQDLETELFNRDLRTRTGKKVSLGHLATILRNPFYIGIIKFKTRKDTYAGVHVPLITSSLFNQVQLILDGKRSLLRQHHQFLFRFVLKCEHCRLYLVGERQKGHVYYRCHRRACPVTCIREERFENTVLEIVKKIAITAEEELALNGAFAEFEARDSEMRSVLRHSLEEKERYIQASMHILLQKFLDGTIPKEAFDDGHARLLMDQKAGEEKMERLDDEQGVSKRVEAFITMLRTIPEQFLFGRRDVKQVLLTHLFTGITTSGRQIHVTPVPIVEMLCRRRKTSEEWAQLLPMIGRELIERDDSSELLRLPEAISEAAFLNHEAAQGF